MEGRRIEEDFRLDNEALLRKKEALFAGKLRCILPLN